MRGATRHATMSHMVDELVGVERRGEICLLTLRRPEKLNALSTVLERALVDALAQTPDALGAVVDFASGQGSSGGGGPA